VKIFVIGKEFFEPLIKFIESRLLRDNMIDKIDLELITLTDDIDYVVTEVKKSLIDQIKILEDMGLNNTNYYKSLSSLKSENDK
jgi:hypothetical protein